MATRRRFSREIYKQKILGREALEAKLQNVVETTLLDHDPTTLPAAVRVAARLTAIIASQIGVQTHSVQRALLSLEDEIVDFGVEFVAQLVKEAQKSKDKRIGRFQAAAPVVEAQLQLADDWAGPVAGPTAIERYYGIPRSTLYRWQKVGEVIALKTRTSSKPVFPLKQFIDGRPAPGISELITLFGGSRQAWVWLVTPDPDDQRPPIDDLLAGKVEQILGMARRVEHGQ